MAGFGGLGTLRTMSGSSKHTVDGQNSAPPKKPWDGVVPCKYQQTIVSHGFLGGTGFRPSTVGVA